MINQCKAISTRYERCELPENHEGAHVVRKWDLWAWSQTPQEITPPPKMYYIQAHGVQGNCAVWWKVDGAGYTADLAQAWRITEEAAAKFTPRAGIDRLVEASYVDRVVVKHVDVQALPGWHSEPCPTCQGTGKSMRRKICTLCGEHPSYCKCIADGRFVHPNCMNCSGTGVK